MLDSAHQPYQSWPFNQPDCYLCCVLLGLHYGILLLLVPVAVPVAACHTAVLHLTQLQHHDKHPHAQTERGAKSRRCLRRVARRFSLPSRRPPMSPWRWLRAIPAIAPSAEPLPASLPNFATLTWLMISHESTSLQARARDIAEFRGCAGQPPEV